MKKKILLICALLIAGSFVFADDVQFLTDMVQEVSEELDLNLVITNGKRSWDEQLESMRRGSKDDEATLKNWYGSETASAYLNYRNGQISKNELIDIMKRNPLMKHPAGLAVDIGINSSGLNNAQVDKVIAALKAKGLYVKDERPQGNSCIHISRSMY